MSERNRGPLFPRIREYAALGAVVAAFAGASASAESTSAVPLRGQNAAELAQHSGGVKLVDIGGFTIGKDHVDIQREAGLRIKNTPYSYENIQKAVRTVSRFEKLEPGLEFLFEYKNLVAALPVTINQSRADEHSYVIVRDQKTVADLSNINGRPEPIPAPADTLNNPKHDASYLSIIDKSQKNDFNPKINLNDLSLQVETCNNFAGLEFRSDSQAYLKKSTYLPESVKSELSRISYEAICNGYGIATASRHAGLKYAQYKKIVDKVELPKSLTVGIDVLFAQFPEKIYSQMG